MPVSAIAATITGTSIASGVAGTVSTATAFVTPVDATTTCRTATRVPSRWLLLHP